MKLKTLGLPVGAYAGEFAGIEETNHAEYGGGVVWRFVIHGGPFDGQIAQRVTGTNPSAKSACGKMLKAISGTLPGINEEVEVDEFIGRKFQLVIEETENGGTRVGAVLPFPESGT